MASPNIIPNNQVESLLENIAEELPIIRPISEFIHLNLLLPYQHTEFWEALKSVSEKFEAMPFAEQSFYRDKILRKDIEKEHVLHRLKMKIGSKAHDVLDNFLETDFEFIHHDQRIGRLHDLWNKTSGINIIQLSDGMLIKWLSMYLDQGISLWTMPGSETMSFYEAVRNVLMGSYILPSPFQKKNFTEIFPLDPDVAILHHLNFLCPQKQFQNEYLRESIMTLRGWAGLIHSIEKNKELLPFKRKIYLKEFIALKLTLERAWLIDNDHRLEAPDFHSARRHHKNPLFQNNAFEVFQSCQEVLEERTYKDVLLQIKFLSNEKHLRPAYQAVFCMDDRECSLRRNIEELIPGTQTFGTAGHYGIECLYQHDEDAFPKKQCPAPLTPRYFIKEISRSEKKSQRKHLSHELIQPSHGIGDFLQSFSGAIKSTAILSKNLFFPIMFRKIQNVREISPESFLKIHREDNDHLINGLLPGYTLDEMTTLVFQQLRLIGFVKDFAPLIFIIGHGSNSLNNPYFATYGCGACSGRPGSANARTFVTMANNPEVRRKLKDHYGLEIPESTTFVAGFHDTTRDFVDLYDVEKIPVHQKEHYLSFRTGLSNALIHNAEERAKSFKLVSYRPFKEDAQKEVLKRSLSLFETRPEMGHTNVAFSIVGRRDITKGLNLNRRSFLQSYDPAIDPTGKILAASLGAVIPVTSGISLDYYFSRVDNLRFGAGSKLPQNIVGNIGVSHGTESDLLCGLPFQMIDQHTPLRLFVLVEQTPDIALAAIQGNKLVRDIVYNKWVHYGSWDSKKGQFYIFKDGEMILVNQQMDNLC